MPRPRFSEILVERRRRLGLSIEQASKVLKLKEQVLVAFEEGDFRSIPKSGYAQGMLSSYARYLGLNPREIVDQFQEDLYEHTNGVVSHDLRRRTREGRGAPYGEPTYELPGRQQNANLPSPPHLLPDNPLLGNTDEFDTTSQVRSRSQTWRRGAAEASRADGAYPSAAGRPRQGGGAPGGYRPRAQRPYRRDPQGAGRPQLGDGRARRGDVVRRDVREARYDDDLRYDNDATPYQPASTRQGRRSYRNIAMAERPRVERRRTDDARRQLRSRDARRPPRRPGVAGALQEFFSDPRRTIICVLALLVVLLVVIISTSVASCTAAPPKEPRTVNVETVSQDDGAKDAADTNDQDADAEKDAGSDASSGDGAKDSGSAALDDEDSTAEVRVAVRVADGGVTWLEITNGGQSEVAETVTGPWEKTFTVDESMTIQVSDTSAVTVTKNGENVTFDSRASGVGSAVIQGPAKKAADDEGGDGADGQDDASAADEGDASSSE